MTMRIAPAEPGNFPELARYLRAFNESQLELLRSGLPTPRHADDLLVVLVRHFVRVELAQRYGAVSAPPGMGLSGRTREQLRMAAGSAQAWATQLREPSASLTASERLPVSLFLEHLANRLLDEVRAARADGDTRHEHAG